MTPHSNGVNRTGRPTVYHDEGKPTDSALEYIDARGAHPELRIEKAEDRQTAPPCKTCSLILPMALCTEGKKQCAHRT